MKSTEQIRQPELTAETTMPLEEKLFQGIIAGKFPAPSQVAIKIGHKTYMDKDGKLIEGSHIEAVGKKVTLISSDKEQTNNYIALMTKAENMKTFDNGQPYSEESIKGRLQRYENNLTNNYPFSGCGIFNQEDEKHEGKNFVGFINLTQNGDKKEGILAYIVDTDFQNKGYGTEAAYLSLHNLLPALLKKQYVLVRTNKDSAEAIINQLELKIEATVREDGKFSANLLKRIGFEPEGKVQMMAAYNAPRQKYVIKVGEIVKAHDFLGARENLISQLNSLNPESLPIAQVSDTQTIPQTANLSSRFLEKAKSIKEAASTGRSI